MRSSIQDLQQQIIGCACMGSQLYIVKSQDSKVYLIAQSFQWRGVYHTLLVSAFGIESLLIINQVLGANFVSSCFNGLFGTVDLLQLNVDTQGTIPKFVSRALS